MHATLHLMQQYGFPAMQRGQLDTLQVNLGYRCNQSCLHCHVNASPQRSETMSRETVADVLAFLEVSGVKQLDLTGGAPELNAHFRGLVMRAREIGVQVMDRCNLTILDEPGQEGLAEAMRYWHPFTEEAIHQMEQDAPSDLVLLPLYPQYSKTTTGSSLNEWARCFHPNGWSPRVHVIERFHEDGGYLDSLVEAVSRSMAGFEDPRDVDVIFSAHSVPVSVVEDGDPYQQEIERTVELVWERGGWPARRHLCYQSKVGASRWLSPSMHETVRRLAAEQRKHLLVVPISFVSDHVETLHEIDIEHRQQALSLGIEDYRMTPGLNDSLAFIQALAGLVRRKLSIASAGSSTG